MVKALIEKIVKDKALHAKWLNTLSYMENCGARKISKCEGYMSVGITVLKHAAEEHRHAYYLKKMILKVDHDACPSYTNSELLGTSDTKYYLQKLDVAAARYLRNELNVTGNKLKYLAYLLVTYSIEVRADILYPIYQDILKSTNSKVSVYNIIKEEEGHLEEMVKSLNEALPQWKEHANIILAYENELFEQWIKAISNEIEAVTVLTA